LIELTRLRDADNKVPSPTPGLVHLDLWLYLGQPGPVEPLTDKGSQIAPRYLLGDREELVG